MSAPGLARLSLLLGAAAALRRGPADSLPRMVSYAHLPKTGGSFIERVLMDSLGSQHTMLGYADPARYQAPRDYMRFIVLDLMGVNAFTIGSIRNPCEWYVSLWAAHPPSSPEEIASGLFAERPLQNLSDDVLRFRKFLRHTYETPSEGPLSDPRSWLGVMSTQAMWRFSRDDIVATYLLHHRQGTHFDFVEYDGYVRPIHNPMAPEFPLYLKDRVQKHLGPGAADCWVRTESLQPDLRACLERAERATGLGVNWTSFEESLRRRSHHGSRHGRCGDYFDAGTEELVRAVDGVIFDKFGYKTCCNPE